MHVGPRPPLAFSGYWVYLGEIPCVHIAERNSYTAYSQAVGLGVSTRSPSTGPVDHIAFNGTDYASIRRRLNDCGVAAGENSVGGANLTQLFLRDPNGVKIEINIFTPPTH